MSLARLRNILSHIPAWGTLLLGFGGLLVGDARADKSQLQPIEFDRVPSRQLAFSSNEVAMRIEGDIIYFSQDGIAFEELHLGDVPEAAHLRQLLRDAGALGRTVSVPIGPIIVASGGGSGKGEKPKQEQEPGSRKGK
jgi:hypothetical protein